MTAPNPAKGPPDDETIGVTATYLPARQPAQLTFPETAGVGAVKTGIMEKFGVAEGPTPDGQGQIVFQLFDKDEQLTDMSRTIGDVAAPSRHVKLNLVKQIVQGS